MEVLRDDELFLSLMNVFILISATWFTKLDDNLMHRRFYQLSGSIVQIQTIATRRIRRLVGVFAPA